MTESSIDDWKLKIPHRTNTMIKGNWLSVVVQLHPHLSLSFSHPLRFSFFFPFFFCEDGKIFPANRRKILFGKSKTKKLVNFSFFHNFSRFPSSTSTVNFSPFALLFLLTTARKTRAAQIKLWEKRKFSHREKKARVHLVECASDWWMITKNEFSSGAVGASNCCFSSCASLLACLWSAFFRRSLCRAKFSSDFFFLDEEARFE